MFLKEHILGAASLPEYKGSRGVYSQGTGDDSIKVDEIWDVVTRSATSITVLESIGTEIVGRTAGFRLEIGGTSLVWTWNHWSWGWGSRIKETQLNLETQKRVKNKVRSYRCIRGKLTKMYTWSSLVLGQPLQEEQATHRTSLPVSICTLNSLGGVPSLTFV